MKDTEKETQMLKSSVIINKTILLIGRNNRHTIKSKTFVLWIRNTHLMVHNDDNRFKKIPEIPFFASTTSSGHVLDES